jgi:hypothetical protein
LDEAFDPMAILPSLGIGRWILGRRKHGAMHEQQLLCTNVLEKLASKFQPLDYSVTLSNITSDVAVRHCELIFQILIRYIYVPLGGSKYFAFNMWIVFTFVALWHDIKLNLLAWGWLICLFLVPEIVATAVFSQKRVSEQSLVYFYTQKLRH